MPEFLIPIDGWQLALLYFADALVLAGIGGALAYWLLRKWRR